MRLKYEFEFMELGEDIIAVPVGTESREYRGVIKMNDSANEVFQLLKKETTEEEIVTFLETKYDIQREELDDFVHEMILQLRDQGLLC